MIQENEWEFVTDNAPMDNQLCEIYRLKIHRS